MLRKHMDEVPLWRGDHVAVRQLIEDFARYLYLPRLTGPGVLVDAINKGVIRNRLDPFLFWWSTPKALPSEADIPDELLLAMSGTLQGGFL